MVLKFLMGVDTHTGNLRNPIDMCMGMSNVMNVGFNGWMSLVFEGQDELDEPTAVPLANSFMRSMLARYEM